MSTINHLKGLVSQYRLELDQIRDMPPVSFEAFNEYLDSKQLPIRIFGRRFSPSTVLYTMDYDLYCKHLEEYSKSVDVTGLDSYIDLVDKIKGLEEAVKALEGLLSE